MSFSAKILADSISPAEVRLTTFELTYPRIIHAEMMTHRLFSRNAASSRAIPVKKMIASVMENPYIPSSWGRNQRGMQAGAAVDSITAADSEREWLVARDHAVSQAQRLLGLGIHKQLTNRLLEPFLWYTAIITATEWDNFYHLRDHHMAHPDIAYIAHMMRQEHVASVPRELTYGDWHLPLIWDVDWDKARAMLGVSYEVQPEELPDLMVKVSAGRCARVSYLTHEGVRDLRKDIELHDSLLRNGHMCYDEKTEVLTNSGWKKWEDVSDTDQLLAVDLVTSEAKFEAPSALHSFEVNENLYHVYGQQLDLKVTLNHNMVVSSRKHDGSWTPFKLESASSVQGKPRRYLKSVQFSGSGDVPSYSDSASFMRLLGFFVGDGNAAPDAEDTIHFHLKKQRKIDYLKSLGFPLSEGKGNKFSVSMPGLGAWMRFNCYDSFKKKQIPSWALQLTESQALALFDGLRNSDGSSRRKTWTYSTSSKQVADTLQILLHLHGKVGNLTSSPYGDDSRLFMVNVSDRSTPRVEVNQEGRSLSYTEELVSYKGNVYCATVSTGALLVRRNDKVSVSGNSPFEHVARPYEQVDTTDVPCARARLTWTQEPWWFGNFKGWVQYRSLIPNQEDLLAHLGESR